MKTYDHTWLIAEWERMGEPEVQIYDEDGCNKWMGCEGIYLWQSDMQYRIKCKPWINWEHVSDEYTAIFQSNEGGFLSISAPYEGDYGWHNTGDYIQAEAFSSFTQGTCDWRDSLVMRPVVVDEK